MIKISPFVAAAMVIFAGLAASAADIVNVEIRQHEFYPTTIELPAQQKVTVKLMNSEKTLVKLVGDPLDRAVDAKPDITTVFTMGPLNPGDYEVFDDNQRKVRAKVIVR